MAREITNSHVQATGNRRPRICALDLKCPQPKPSRRIGHISITRSPETAAMSKSHESHKESRKKPQKSAQEKRQGKRVKKSGSTLLGSHAAP